MKTQKKHALYLMILICIAIVGLCCAPPRSDGDLSCQDTGDCWDRLQCVQGKCVNPNNVNPPPTCDQPPCSGGGTEPSPDADAGEPPLPPKPRPRTPPTPGAEPPEEHTTDAGPDNGNQDTGVPCVPTSCQEKGKNCGVMTDGCGKVLNCGQCQKGQTCGQKTPNVCSCQPVCGARTCGLDPVCGTSCGTCKSDETCNATGTCEKPTTPPTGRRDNVPEPTFAQTKKVSKTIVITKSGVYDYKNVLHIWSGKGSCNQKENQPYILRIAASNVTIKNFAYKNAPDGIHIGTSSSGQGHTSGSPISNIVLENVTGWACEDALTTQYGVRDVTIKKSKFFGNPNPSYRDKLMQFNFGDITIEDTIFKDTSTCLMFKGGQNVRIVRSLFINCDRGVNGSSMHGIVGKISSQPSTLYTEGNEAYYKDRASKFWDPWHFVTGDGKITMTSVKDKIYDNGKTYAKHGATLTTR